MFLNLALEAERAPAGKKCGENFPALSVEREAKALIESSSADTSQLSEDKLLHPNAEVEADAGITARRQRVLCMLENTPSIRYALLSDTEARGDDVILTLGIRDLGMCELAIPRAKYDAFKVLRIVEEHSTGAA